MVDRKDLLDYITGKVDHSDRIDITAPSFVGESPNTLEPYLGKTHHTLLNKFFLIYVFATSFAKKVASSCVHLFHSKQKSKCVCRG